jgi:hypothetical protein
VVVLGTGFLLLGGLRGDVSPGAWLGLFACFLLIGSAVELVKYFINRSRLELLKEMKGIELQLLEIKQHLQR